jgi:hypothetical protein
MRRAELFRVRADGPEGQWVETLIALGDDESVWMEPDYLELRPAEMEVIQRLEPGCVRTERRSRKVLVNLTRAVPLLSSRERQKELYVVATEHLVPVLRESAERLRRWLDRNRPE